MTNSIPIDKIYFMIHPCSWAASADGPSTERKQTEGFSVSNWYTALNWEVDVNKRQHELIDEIKPNELLIIFPSRESDEMRELIKHGEAALGERCIVCREPDSVPLHHEPKTLSVISEPIRHFLEDNDMEGRDIFWNLVPQKFKRTLYKEIKDISSVIGYSWPPSALNLLAIAHIYANDISYEIGKRGFIVNPNTVKSEAFGEGFEQCAMHWKSMIPGHLNWSRPIENNFNLSVSGGQLLFDAKLIERVPLPNNIRLFLWEKSHGIPLALFAKASAKFTDSSYDVKIPLTQLEVEAWDLQHKLWPTNDSILGSDGGYLSVPVLSATSRRPNETCYLIGCNVTYENFRNTLLQAEFTKINP
jgi:hypothetical protein